jgi:hypothetical protein
MTEYVKKEKLSVHKMSLSYVMLHSKNTKDIEFYPRVINETNITSNDELTLLSQGLKYNLHYDHKNWTETSALEAEADICQLPSLEQDCMRYLSTSSINQL